MDGIAIRGEPFGNGDADRAVIAGERNPILYGAFSIGSDTDKLGTAKVLQVLRSVQGTDGAADLGRMWAILAGQQ